MHGALTTEGVGGEDFGVRLLEDGLMPSAFGYKRLYIVSEGKGRYILAQKFGRAEAPYYFFVDRAELFGFMPEGKATLYEITFGNHNSLREGETLDLRPLEHAIRHPLVMKKFSQLGESEALFIINDHDPLPLYFQMAMAFPKKVGWEYVEYGNFWKIKIWRL